MNLQVNKFIKGRLGSNPELKYTRDQKPICIFSVAENTLNSTTVNWHKIVVWGKQAESCQVFLKKGSLVFVQGQKINQIYKNKNGEDKSSEEIIADIVAISLA